MFLLTTLNYCDFSMVIGMLVTQLSYLENIKNLSCLELIIVPAVAYILLNVAIIYTINYVFFFVLTCNNTFPPQSPSLTTM